MTDPTTEKPAVETPEITGEPTSATPSAASSSGGDSAGGPGGNQPAVNDLAEQVAALVVPKVREALRPDMERVFQSSKDVRFKKVEGLDPDDIRLVADALRTVGGDPEKAADELGLRALIASRRAPTKGQETSTQEEPTSQTVSGKTRGEQDAEILEILSSANLSDGQQQAVLKEWKISGPYPSMGKALTGLNMILVRSMTGGSPPAAALGVGNSGRPPVESGDKTEHTDRLYNELADLQREPSKNRAEMARVTKALRDLGESI
jgi:hypothetical protein